MTGVVIAAVAGLGVGFGVGVIVGFEVIVQTPKLAKQVLELSELEQKARELGGRRNWRGRWVLKEER